MRSDEWILFAVVAGLVVVVGGIIWLVWWTNKRRREAWMAAALELDFQYLPEDASVIDAFGHFKLFQQGRRKRAKNVLRGRQRDCQLTLCDYQYTTGHGKHQQVHHQTICLVQCPNLSLAHSFLRKQRRVSDFLGKLFGGQDINFDEDPEFSKAFVLQGGDEGATRALFDARLREHFLRFRGTGLQFESLGDTFLVHNGRRIKPEEARGLVEQTLEVRQLLR
jgi:hypothetical protein